MRVLLLLTVFRPCRIGVHGPKVFLHDLNSIGSKTWNRVIILLPKELPSLRQTVCLSTFRRFYHIRNARPFPSTDYLIPYLKFRLHYRLDPAVILHSGDPR